MLGVVLMRLGFRCVRSGERSELPVDAERDRRAAGAVTPRSRGGRGELRRDQVDLRVGGITGDCLGTAERLGEIPALAELA